MTRLLGLVLLCALGTFAPPNAGADRAPRVEEIPYAYRPGTGTVEYVTRVETGGTAAAGGTAGRIVDGVAYRLTVRMDDGSVQTVLQDSAGFSVGDRVRLSQDGMVIRL